MERVERIFAQRLRELRAERDLSQAALAKQLQEHGLQLDDLAILRIEKNEEDPLKGRRVRLGEATVIAQALGVRLDEMLQETKSPELRRAMIEAELAHARASWRSAIDQEQSAHERRLEWHRKVLELESLSAKLQPGEKIPELPGEIYVDRATGLNIPVGNLRSGNSITIPMKNVLKKTLTEVADGLIKDPFWIEVHYSGRVGTHIDLGAAELRRRAVLRLPASAYRRRRNIDKNIASKIASHASSMNVPRLDIPNLDALQKRLIATSKNFLEIKLEIAKISDNDPAFPDASDAFRELFRQFLSAVESYAYQLFLHVDKVKQAQV